MTTKEFYSALFEKIKKRPDVILKSYPLHYEKGIYDFIKITSKEIGPKDKIILIRAGIHGDEIAGPLTFFNYFDKIIDYIHEKNLKFIIYPLGNPSGFETGNRYNIDNDRGEAGNGDFLRYELKNGKFVDDIKDSNKFIHWYWSSDKRLGIKLPLETKFMHQLLREGPLAQVVAVIDLHQDYITPDAPPAAYHYAFGRLIVYRKIVEEVEKIVPIWRKRKIGAGEADAMRSDENGFIVRHDGSLPDLFYRQGVKYCVTVETTGVTPIDDACKVNLIWIYGIVDLVNSRN